MGGNHIVGAFVAIAAVVIGVGIWFGVTHNWGCPKGQQLVVTGYVPVTNFTTGYGGQFTGSYVTMTPIYACEANNG